MDSIGWFGLVVLCSWWLRASSADSMGRKFLSELNGSSSILLEMGFWDIILCMWALFAIFVILAISMARSKNIRKGKAPSFSMERAVKKTESRNLADRKEREGKTKRFFIREQGSIGKRR